MSETKTITEVKTVNFKKPRSMVERLRIHFAVTRFVWFWLWRHRGENLSLRFSVNEDEQAHTRG